jgi:two-component system, LuxR family, response regulator FixJ
VDEKPTVFIVDDDPAIRQSSISMMRSMDLEAEDFSSAKEFLEAFDPVRSGCLLLDLRLPDMSGLELLERINKQIVCMPAIVISANAKAPIVVRAMRAGALNFLEKPCSDRFLRTAIHEAFEWDAVNRRRLVRLVKVCRRLENLTSGEYSVLEKILEGKSNKKIAADLNVSVRAVEVRRAKIMRKMRAESLVNLIRMTTWAVIDNKVIKSENLYALGR